MAPKGIVRLGAYDQRTQPRGADQPFVRAPDVGPGLAPGLAALAGAAGDHLQANDAIERLRIAREEDDARVYVSAAMARARASASEIRRRALLEAPDGWRGVTGRVSGEWGQLREEALTAAPTPSAQRFLQQAFDQFQPLLLEDAAGGEQDARQRWRLDTVRGAITTDSGAIASDPRLYAQAVGQQRELINGMVDLDADARRDLIQSMESEYATVAVAGMIETDPVAALRALRGVSASGGADPAQIAALLGGSITSTQRDPEHNAAVGGVPGSMHISGEAVDLSVPARYSGMSRADIETDVRQRLDAAGIAASEVIFEGDHIHVGWRGAGGGEAAPIDASSPVAALSGAQRLTLTRQAEAEIERRATATRTDMRDQIETARSLWELGEQAPGAPSVEAVRAGFGDAAAAAYEMDMQAAQAGSDMQGLSNDELNRLAATPPLAEGSDRDRFDNIVRRRAAAAILEQRLDPAAYAVRQGLITDTDDMNTAIGEGDFAQIGQRLRRRASVALEQRDRIGTPPAPFTVPEAASLRAQLDRLSPEQRLSALRTMRDGASLPRMGARGRGDENVYAAMVGQIYGDNPGAYAGALLADRRASIEVNGSRIDSGTAARRLMNGAALLNPPRIPNERGELVEQRSTFDMPPANVLQSAFGTYVGDAYAGDPGGQERAFQAFRAYFAGAASERGVTAGALQWISDGRGGGTLTGDGAAVELAGEAAQVAVGDVIENQYGGSPGLPTRVYLPWGMNEDRFMGSLNQGWETVRERYPEAGLADDPSDYDYARDEGGFYTVFYRGVPVPDGQGGFVRVRPRMREQ